MSVYVNGVEQVVAHEATHVSGGSDDIDSALALAGIPGFMPKSKLAFTLNKLIKGAGAGVEPTEIDVPSAGTLYTSGSYVGDDAHDRAIPHGLGTTPRIVFITDRASTIVGAVTGPNNVDISMAHQFKAVTNWDATNFYVTHTDVSLNEVGHTHDWIAFL